MYDISTFELSHNHETKFAAATTADLSARQSLLSSGNIPWRFCYSHFTDVEMVALGHYVTKAAGVMAQALGPCDFGWYVTSPP